MNSSFTKLLLIVLAWPLAALGIIQAYEWYQEATYVRLVEPLSQDRIQHPSYYQFAQSALQAYGALPKDDRQALKEALRQAIVPVAVGLEKLNKSGAQVFCLGESHDDYNRAFMAASLMPAFDTDHLFIETTQNGVHQIRASMSAGDIYVPLLGPHIGHVLQAATTKNPNLRIQGIEETNAQRERRYDKGGGSRDTSIFANLKNLYDPKGRSIVLYGALHCDKQTGELYKLMRQDLGRPETAFRSMLVQGAHQDGIMETFVYFLDEIGIAPGDFMINDTGSLPLWVQENFTWLWAQTLTHFDTVIVYRP